MTIKSGTQVSLAEVLAVGTVDARKLESLEQLLTASLGRPLNLIPYTDAMDIRRRMGDYLRRTGGSEGLVQAVEQLFMGIVRRAAVVGIVAAPADGPWSSSWQSVLDSSKTHKARLRQLAGWSSARGIEPQDVSRALLRTWGATLGLPENSVLLVWDAIPRRGRAVTRESRRSAAQRTERLRLKAAHGTSRQKESPAGKR
jgi:hypothetical protein